MRSDRLSASKAYFKRRLMSAFAENNASQEVWGVRATNRHVKYYALRVDVTLARNCNRLLIRLHCQELRPGKGNSRDLGFHRCGDEMKLRADSRSILP